MTFFEKVGTVVEEFCSAYGTGFGLMVLAGFIIAFIVEVGVKKAFEYLESVIGDKPYLEIARMVTIFAVTIIGSVASTVILLKGDVVLPGNKALAPFWFMLIYIIQYVFSMYGIKAFLKIKDRPKTEKPPKEKKVSPVEGMEKIARNVYRDASGNLFNKKGVRL